MSQVCAIEEDVVQSAAIVRAVELCRNGDLDGAREAYLSLVNHNPSEARFLNTLAALEMKRGDFPHAIKYMREAVSLTPDDPLYLFNLAESLRASGQTEEAVSWYQAAARYRRPFPECWHALGAAYARLNRVDDAIAALEESVSQSGRAPRFVMELAKQLFRANRYQLCETVCFASVFDNPDDARFDNLLILAAESSESIEELARELEHAAESGIAEHARFRVAARLLFRLRKVGQAAALILRSVELNPDNAAARIQLGRILESKGRLSQAIANYELAAELEVGNPEPHIRLGGCNLQVLQHDKAEYHFRRAVQLSPTAANQQKLLLGLSYSEKTDDVALYQEHVRWAEMLGGSLSRGARKIGARRRIGDFPLRVGYLSADFKDHPVSRFIEPILHKHNRSRVKPILLSNSNHRDAVTDRLKSYADEWHDVFMCDDNDLARLIRNLKLDVLIDLSGHTAGSRLSIFRSRLAPIQINYLGYPNTTGMSREEINYRLTDNICDPPSNDQLHTEELVRLDGCFLCFRPHESAPEVAPPPFDRNRFITFGCFSNIAKITRRILENWAKIMCRVERSRLILKNSGLWELENRRSIEDIFEKAGVLTDRLTLLTTMPATADHLSLYGDVDIALDTFPYNGTTTTCEALWMGVPVISNCGQSHRSRVGASILKSVQLEAQVTNGEESYVEAAAELANQTEYLRQQRSTLRERMRESGLCQEEEFVCRFDDMLVKLHARSE
jgi:protein O-GlcNAc transferase